MKVGPVSFGRWGLRVGSLYVRGSRRNLASWGYEAVRLGGLHLFSRTNGGELMIASYHHPSETCWRWSLTLCRKLDWSEKTRWRSAFHASRSGAIEMKPPAWWTRFACLAPSWMRRGQWHDHVRLPGRHDLRISRQDYHVQMREADRARAAARRLHADREAQVYKLVRKGFHEGYRGVRGNEEK